MFYVLGGCDRVYLFFKFVTGHQNLKIHHFIAACDPIDDGPIPPVVPTLYPAITEATQEGIDSHGHSNNAF